MLNIIITEIQIKTAVRNHYALTCMAKPQHLTIMTAGNDAEKQE